MEIHSGQAGIDEAMLYYEEAGRGFPIVFIHGADTDHTMWDDQFTVIGREYRAIRYDLRGCGRSFTNPVPSSHMNDLYLLMQSRGIDQAVLVGYGLGAQIAIDFALARPRHTAGVVLVNPAAHVPSTAPLGVIPATGAQAGVQFRDEHKDVLPLDATIVRRLRQMRVPGIVITGEDAPSEILRAARLLYNTIPNALNASLPGASRMPNHERPNQFNRILLTFFDWVNSRLERSGMGGG